MRRGPYGPCCSSVFSDVFNGTDLGPVQQGWSPEFLHNHEGAL